MRYPGKGAELRMGDGAGTEQFTKIIQLSSIGLGQMTQNTESVVDHDTPEHAEEHVETTKDYGSVPFEGHWDPAETTHAAGEVTGLVGRFEAGGIRNYQVAAPDIPGFGTATFAASIENLQPGPLPVDGKVMISGQLKISGVVVWE